MGAISSIASLLTTLGLHGMQGLDFAMLLVSSAYRLLQLKLPLTGFTCPTSDDSARTEEVLR